MGGKGGVGGGWVVVGRSSHELCTWGCEDSIYLVSCQLHYHNSLL